MGGVIAGGVGFLLALFLFIKGVQIERRERRLLERMLPTKGRVTGEASGTSVFVSSDANGNRTERLDIEYEGRYEYRVGTQTFAGKVTSPKPNFDKTQMPPNEITVYYDRDDPAVSRLSRHSDRTGQSYMLFAAVVFVVAGLIVTIANADWM